MKMEKGIPGLSSVRTVLLLPRALVQFLVRELLIRSHKLLGWPKNKNKKIKKRQDILTKKRYR